MTQIISALSEVSDRYDVLYCDLWGCLHDGLTAFPDAVAALRGFKAGGGTVLLLTNSPRPRASVERQLAKIGVPPDCWDIIASSGDSAAAEVRRTNAARSGRASARESFEMTAQRMPRERSAVQKPTTARGCPT